MAQVIISKLEARQRRIPAGKRYEGQHCQADGITPSPGDEFWAWDTGFVLREKDGSWCAWFRTLPFDRNILAGTSVFSTESF